MYQETELITTEYRSVGPGRAVVHFAVTAAHPLFDEHFPGHPVLPGSFLASFLITCCESAWGISPTLEEITFVDRTLPGTTYRLTLNKAGTTVRLVVLEAATGRRTCTGVLRIP